MKQLWNVVNGLGVRKDAKARVFLWLLAVANILIGAGLWLLIGRILRVFLWLLAVANILIGAGLWLLIGRIFLPGTEWLICFMGYPAIFIGFFGGVIYLCNHEFS